MENLVQIISYPWEMGMIVKGTISKVTCRWGIALYVAAGIVNNKCQSLEKCLCFWFSKSEKSINDLTCLCWCKVGFFDKLEKFPLSCNVCRHFFFLKFSPIAPAQDFVFRFQRLDFYLVNILVWKYLCHIRLRRRKVLKAS